LAILLGITAFGQHEKFGTYYNQRRTLFEKLPDTKREIEMSFYHEKQFRFADLEIKL